MAFSKQKSRKCPVCVGCTPTKVKEIDQALSPILEDVKQTGEIPKAQDTRLDLVAQRVGISPHSLRYHLKECLVDQEIQDQRFQELKDIIDCVSTAKQEYLANPGMGQATALSQLLTQFRGLADDIEGQFDPEVTVEYVVETVLNPLSRKTLAVAAEELRSLREAMTPLVSKNQMAYVDAQMKATLTRISAVLRDSLDESLKTLCSYYKVELEAKARKRALDSGVTSTPALFNAPAKSSTDDDDDVVH
jgi:AcrR family transcriptional regulator